MCPPCARTSCRVIYAQRTLQFALGGAQLLQQGFHLARVSLRCWCRHYRQAIWTRSRNCSVGCAIRVTYWPGIRTCSGWRAAIRRPGLPVAREPGQWRHFFGRAPALGRRVARWTIRVPPFGARGGFTTLPAHATVLPVLRSRCAILLDQIKSFERNSSKAPAICRVPR